MAAQCSRRLVSTDGGSRLSDGQSEIVELAATELLSAVHQLSAAAVSKLA